MRRDAAPFALALGLGLASCATIRGTVPAPVPIAASGRFLAGAAKVDLTPMPGYPMGGHSVAGTTARGYWTRLFARSIYFEDADGGGLALVSCDLWSLPAGLADRAAEIVARAPEARHLGRSRIVFAATHTHHSPGNFSSSKAYNQFASRWAGFDPRLFEFLAHRIAESVVTSVRTKRPARVLRGETVVPGLCRNRSLVAFRLDPEAEEILAENAALPVGPTSPEYPDPDAWRAVDPTLTVLRVEEDGRGGRPIALAAFVAVHPTAMSHATEVYNADLFGVSATTVERALAGDGAGAEPVAAIFNGAEGDVSPAWVRQDAGDALALGRLLADRILGAPLDATSVEGPVACAFEVVPLADRTFHDAEGRDRSTAEEAVPGVAELGGAEDGVTLFADLGWDEGVKGPRTAKHGAKQPAFDPRFLSAELPLTFTKILARRYPPPKRIPLGVYRVGGVRLATLPGEFTTVMGRRIARAIGDSFGDGGRGRVLLVGLANEYVSYFATPEEYEAQHYEGASTLYGPASGPLVERELVRLARDLGSSAAASDRPHEYRYAPGGTRRFGVGDVGARPYAEDDGLAEVALDPATGRPNRRFPRFVWTDRAPEFPARFDEAVRVTPDAWIEERLSNGEWRPLVVDGTPEDDRGLGLVTVALEARGETCDWVSIWLRDPTPDPPERFRFAVRGIDGLVRRSPPFPVAP